MGDSNLQRLTLLIITLCIGDLCKQYTVNTGKRSKEKRKKPLVFAFCFFVCVAGTRSSLLCFYNCKSITIIVLVLLTWSYFRGVPRIWEGGGQEIFFSDLGICMSRSDMLRMAKLCALLGGFGGMPPRETYYSFCGNLRLKCTSQSVVIVCCHFYTI